MCRILLVDDDPTLRSTLATFVSRLGLGCPTEASNGLEALSCLSALPADLVITDCQMPTMDGISFVKALRARGHAMPVIMLSGQGDPRVVQLALHNGVTRYLPKPMNPMELVGEIQHLLAAATGSATASSQAA